MTDVLTRRLARSQRQVAALTEMVESKTRELFLANRELSSVLRSMAGALVVVDGERRVSLVNDRLLRLTGFDEEDVIGGPASQVLPAIGTFRPAGADKALEEDTLLCRADGTAIPVTLTHAAIAGDDGHIYVAIDARERKAVAAALEQAQQQLVEASRAAGMAQIATGIIHNVGNVLSAVNTSVHTLRDANRRSKVAGLEKLAAMLAAEDATAVLAGPKGAQIPGYVARVAGALVNEQTQRDAELATVLEHLEHLKAVVGRQQSYASRTVALAPANVCDLVSHVVMLCRGRAADARADLDWIRCAPLVFETDRHLVLEVLVNLVSNAIEATAEVEGDRRVRIAVRATPDQVQFAVRDNGCGVPDSLKTKIFVHGFTTRDDGHGFGLHTAANAATTLGGSLHCTSGGVGQGATFVLSLPRSA